MKNIIKPGKISKITYHMICPYCGCEYTYTDEDIFSNYSLLMSCGSRVVSCPCCNSLNPISLSYNNITCKYENEESE